MKSLRCHQKDILELVPCSILLWTRLDKRFWSYWTMWSNSSCGLWWLYWMGGGPVLTGWVLCGTTSMNGRTWRRTWVQKYTSVEVGGAIEHCGPGESRYVTLHVHPFQMRTPSGNVAFRAASSWTTGRPEMSCIIVRVGRWCEWAHNSGRSEGRMVKIKLAA